MTKQTRRLTVMASVAMIGLATLAVPAARADDSDSPRYTTTVLAIKRAEPAVVNIEGNKPASNVVGSTGEKQQVNGMGAGVIVDPRGYILTNQHVIQDVGRIEVTLGDCRYPEDNPTGEGYAWLTIRDPGRETVLFDGWMSASSPALNALDHPRYDVWVIRCTTA